MHSLWLADDKAILDQAPYILPRVSVRDLADFIGIEPYLQAQYTASTLTAHFSEIVIVPCSCRISALSRRCASEGADSTWRLRAQGTRTLLLSGANELHTTQLQYYHQVSQNADIICMEHEYKRNNENKGIMTSLITFKMTAVLYHSLPLRINYARIRMITWAAQYHAHNVDHTSVHAARF